jgi:hypothetical protein
MVLLIALFGVSPPLLSPAQGWRTAGQANRSCRLCVDVKLEFRWLLNWQIARGGAPKDFIYLARRLRD